MADRRRGHPPHQAGELDKVVLAREVVVTADQPVRAADGPHPAPPAVPGLLPVLGRRLRRRQPRAAGGHAPATWCGPSRWPAPPPAAATRRPTRASPPRCSPHPSTATSTRSRSTSSTTRCSASARTSTTSPSRRSSPLANVQHLATSVEGRLSHPPASVLELVGALHPTPAVCGRPRQAAQDLIAELEQLDRGRYAGHRRLGRPVGQRHVRGQHPRRHDRRQRWPGSSAGTASSATPTPTPS